MAQNLAIIESRLPYDEGAARQRGVEPGQWRVLVESVWPNARTADAVHLALDYCRARKLDPFKRPCHIVPMWNSELRKEVETVWPGISDIRTTAARTTEYAGADETLFGEDITKTFEGKTAKGEKLTATVTFPSWAKVTVYRIIKGQRVPFPGPRVVWLETYSQMKGTPVPNAKWQRSPTQMLEKCAEAAALRKAFPEELGSTYAAEEMEGKPVENVEALTIPEIREEAQFIIREMESCTERVQLDCYFQSTPVKRFLENAEATAKAKTNSINHADVVRQFYEQFKDALPEKKTDKRTLIKSVDEYPNPAQSGAGVAPAAQEAQNPPPESPIDATAGYRKAIENARGDKAKLASIREEVLLDPDLFPPDRDALRQLIQNSKEAA